MPRTDGSMTLEAPDELQEEILVVLRSIRERLVRLANGAGFLS